MRKKKSACSVRNDRLEGVAGTRKDGGLKAAATREGSERKAQSSARRQGCFGCGVGTAGAAGGVADRTWAGGGRLAEGGAVGERAADRMLAELLVPVCGPLCG